MWLRITYISSDRCSFPSIVNFCHPAKTFYSECPETCIFSNRMVCNAKWFIKVRMCLRQQTGIFEPVYVTSILYEHTTIQNIHKLTFFHYRHERAEYFLDTCCKK